MRRGGVAVLACGVLAAAMSAVSAAPPAFLRTDPPKLTAGTGTIYLTSYAK